MGLAAFVVIGEDVGNGGGPVSPDRTVLTWFVDQRTSWMISLARIVSDVGEFVSLLFVGLALALWLWRRGWPVAIAIGPVVSLLLGGLAFNLAKSAFGRPRPPVRFREVRVASSSFPSGHATDAASLFLAAGFVLAITLGPRRRGQAACIGAGILLAALVGLSRLVLAVHWLSDVVAGWALGASTASTVVVVLWYASTCRPRAEDERRRTRAPDPG